MTILLILYGIMKTVYCNNESRCIFAGKIHLNCTEHVKYSMKDFQSSRGNYFELHYYAFQTEFVINLYIKEVPLIHLTQYTNLADSNTNVKYIYEGAIQNKPNTYAYATYRNNILMANLEDGKYIYKLQSTNNHNLSVTLDDIENRVFDIDDAQGKFSFDNSNYKSKYETPKNRTRRSNKNNNSKNKSQQNRVCTLNIVLSESYFEDICKGSIAICVERVLWIVHFVDRYYQRVDFDLDGESDNIGVVLRNLSIMGLTKKYNIPDSRNATLLLKSFQHLEHGRECVNVLMLNRWLIGGILGLAFIPEIGSSGYISQGGICYTEMPITDRFLNSLMVTQRSKDDRITARHLAITLMHELGHSFGSPHDEHKSCKDHRNFGNFLMFPSTKNIFNPNVLRFSRCSRIKIKNILEARGRCIRPFNRNKRVCGDYKISMREECDCGSDANYCMEFDKCCSVPLRGNPSCLLNRTLGYICSDRKYSCCKNCQVSKEQEICRVGDECMQDSFCDTFSYICPKSIIRTDGTACASGSRVCKNGQCVGSLCSLYGWLDCFCNETLSQMCLRCCRLNETSKCQSIKDINPYDTLVSDIKLQQFDICNYGRGFCNSEYICKEKNASLYSSLQSYNTINVIFIRILVFMSIVIICYILTKMKCEGIISKRSISNERTVNSAKMQSLLEVLNANHLHTAEVLRQLELSYGRSAKDIESCVEGTSLTSAFSKIKMLFPFAKESDIFNELKNNTNEVSVVCNLLLKRNQLRTMSQDT